MSEPARRLDVFWSFRSPYSYLAMDRLAAMKDEFALDLRMRFVRPLALREEGFFKRVRPQFMPYLMRDVFREAERLCIPIAAPRPDPVVMDMQTGVVPPDQPWLPPLMRLGVAAEAGFGAGLPVAHGLARLIWSGTENWQEGDHIAGACRSAGLPLEDIEAWAAPREALISEIIERNEADQLVHHWGVPLMVLEGEPFFGQDRLNALRWRLEQGRGGA